MNERKGFLFARPSKVRRKLDVIGGRQGVVWLCLYLFLQSSCQLVDADFADSLGPIGAYSQARVVKIYGAKVGRTPGYTTGLVVGPEGLILTANGTHLNGERIRVALPDGRVLLANAERRSRTHQLALLRIPTKTPQYFDLSGSPTVFKGQWVLTISNLFKIADGVDPMSVMLGVVSLQTKLEAKRGTRPFPYEGDVLLLDCISSNPGAPGGAVVDAESGHLVGMIGPNLESRSSRTKLNYAIPVPVLRDFVKGQEVRPAIANKDRSAKAYLGIRLFRLGGKRSPAYIDRVAKGSPAAKAKLRPDDVVLSIGDERIKTIQQYDDVFANLVPGENVEIAIKRGQKVLHVVIQPVAAD